MRKNGKQVRILKDSTQGRSQIVHRSFAGCQIPTSRGQILELWSRTSVGAARLENRLPYEEKEEAKNSSNQIHRRDRKLVKCGAKLFLFSQKQKKINDVCDLVPGQVRKWFHFKS